MVRVNGCKSCFLDGQEVWCMSRLDASGERGLGRACTIITEWPTIRLRDAGLKYRPICSERYMYWWVNEGNVLKSVQREI